MKFALNWHEHCLRSMKLSLERDLRVLELQATAIERLREDINFTARQIATAREEGLEEFDPERYLKRRSR